MLVVSRNQKEWIIALTLAMMIGGLGAILILHLTFKFHDWLWNKL